MPDKEVNGETKAKVAVAEVAAEAVPRASGASSAAPASRDPSSIFRKISSR